MIYKGFPSAAKTLLQVYIHNFWIKRLQIKYEHILKTRKTALHHIVKAKENRKIGLDPPPLALRRNLVLQEQKAYVRHSVNYSQHLAYRRRSAAIEVQNSQQESPKISTNVGESSTVFPPPTTLNQMDELNWLWTLGKKCRKIAGILPENFCVPFRSVFYPFLEKKTGIARMESGKKKIRFFSVFFPDCVF